MKNNMNINVTLSLKALKAQAKAAYAAKTVNVEDLSDTTNNRVSKEERKQFNQVVVSSSVIQKDRKTVSAIAKARAKAQFEASNKALKEVLK